MTPGQAKLLAATEREIKEARLRAERRRLLANSSDQKQLMLALADTDDASAKLYETFAEKMKSEWGQ